MSPEMGADLGERIEIPLMLRELKVTLRMYPDEAKEFATSIEARLSDVLEGRGVALFLPALPSDEGYRANLKEGDWMHRSYIFLAAYNWFDEKSPLIQEVPAPVLTEPQEKYDEFLRRMNLFFGGKLRVIPAGVFSQLRGWFPDDIGIVKHRLEDHLTVNFPILPQVDDLFRELAPDFSSYKLLYRMGLDVEKFLKEVPEAKDLELDSMLLRMVKQGKYARLRRHTHFKYTYNYHMPGFDGK